MNCTYFNRSRYGNDCSESYYAPAPVGEAGALGGHRRLSSVCPSVCLMSRTSALTRKPKGLGRRNFAQEYPRSHATPTPTSRSKGQKSRWGGGILWRRPSRTACSFRNVCYLSGVLRFVIFRMTMCVASSIASSLYSIS